MQLGYISLYFQLFFLLLASFCTHNFLFIGSAKSRTHEFIAYIKITIYNLLFSQISHKQLSQLGNKIVKINWCPFCKIYGNLMKSTEIHLFELFIPAFNHTRDIHMIGLPCFNRLLSRVAGNFLYFNLTCFLTNIANNRS